MVVDSPGQQFRSLSFVHEINRRPSSGRMELQKDGWFVDGPAIERSVDSESTGQAQVAERWVIRA